MRRRKITLRCLAVVAAAVVLPPRPTRAEQPDEQVSVVNSVTACRMYENAGWGPLPALRPPPVPPRNAKPDKWKALPWLIKRGLTKNVRPLLEANNNVEQLLVARYLITDRPMLDAVMALAYDYGVGDDERCEALRRVVVAVQLWTNKPTRANFLRTLDFVENEMRHRACTMDEEEAVRFLRHALKQQPQQQRRKNKAALSKSWAKKCLADAAALQMLQQFKNSANMSGNAWTKIFVAQQAERWNTPKGHVKGGWDVRDGDWFVDDYDDDDGDEWTDVEDSSDDCSCDDDGSCFSWEESKIVRRRRRRSMKTTAKRFRKKRHHKH